MTCESNQRSSQGKERGYSSVAKLVNSSQPERVARNKPQRNAATVKAWQSISIEGTPHEMISMCMS